MKCGPIATPKDHEVVFGYVEGENRGNNAMNPPRRRNDPLFWLRDDSRKNPEVIAHLKLEQAYFEERTADIKDFSETIFKEYISHIKETDISAPYRYDGYTYYTREVEGLSYKIHCRVPLGMTPGKSEDEQVILDENKLAEGKPFCMVHEVKPAPPDHNLVAYSVDYIGNEMYTIRFTDNAVTDVVEGTNGQILWGPNASCFFYMTKDAAERDYKIWRHIIGRPQSEDVCLYTENDLLFSTAMAISGDGSTLIIGSGSFETTESQLLDLRKGNGHTTLEMVRPREKGVRYDVELHGTENLLILTNKDNCMNGKVVLATRNTPSDWENIIVPHSEDVFIGEIGVFAKFAVLSGRRGGLTRVWTMPVGSDGLFRSGAFVQEVSFDEPVFTAFPVFSHMKMYDTETLRVSYTSMSTPTTWFDLHVVNGTRTIVKVREVLGNFDAKNYTCRRLFATAPDRTKIPLSIVHDVSLDMSKPHPTVLYAYGSYGVCVEPEFSVKYLPYLDRGVIYVIAHVRGGGEMGRAWYEVGAKYLTKRNTFSDFIACAEYLIEIGLTTPSQLACEGRSAGGLLIGAVLNMRPDLFRVALAGVPFVDVMTTMCDPSIPLTTGEWEEWGNPNEYKFFDYMNSYSPVDNVRAQDYPHLMIQAGLHDPRVAYWEPAKWASKLRALKTDSNEVLLKMDLESGHFSASDRYRYWREMSFQQAFVLKHLNARTLLRR
ncbi:oligopeptidase b [Trypanosoma cruzi]|uniref:Prolyl endopeptidase n=2 Tax=Trypanosoma cruzi TaxID=5693 RepID=Q4D6H1_TRYCC|nr:oligopeptidase B, putative [Trypanosoma cruzi]EAN88116.1 oligopeptidase B, putative [Trypanosoma cruzi]PWV13009.1 oligopeptidase b [Trypanosoma cruzi]|eukprot:XP_809967.1 oligopeptidase B [Trypanosoma cruzi strain CL Brener]